ncbi:uncharacterized protein LOC119074265 [Bradysia coprophila]|uniref:uncharacterized protein LOC119074265 n=1 Tax=Bradysia coprophila TaxID=38358 RepID=UPI00187DADB2|nr:uncharacterized protein LOC119074265 [Bradysia coprophila]
MDTATQRCLTGDVGQVLEFKKNHPDAFYEVFAKIFKVTTKEHQRILLLRNDSGPILQAIFSEIDVKMDDLKPGDSVRAVGKFKNHSFLNIFKIRNVSDDNASYVRRLSSIGSFALKKSKK